MNDIHNHLLGVVGSLLDQHHPQSLTPEVVQAASHYEDLEIANHFEDFDDLVEQACLERLALQVSYAGQRLRLAEKHAKNFDDYRAALVQINRDIQCQSRAHARAERLEITLMAKRRPRMAAKLANLQAEITADVANSVRDAQHKGWLRSDLNAHALALFIQAYTVGAVLNDVSADKLSDEDWIEFIAAIIDRAVLKPPTD